MNKNWQSAVLLLAALALGFVLARDGILPGAQAQGDGAAGHVICVMGLERSSHAPVVLVDTLEQSILVYDYSYASRNLKLESARTYRFDKMLIEFENSGPSIGDVRNIVRQQPEIR